MYRCCACCSGSIAVLILEVGIFVLTGLWCRSRRWSVLCGFLLALALLFFFLHFGCGVLLFGCFLEFLCFCFLVCTEIGSASPDEFVVFYRSAVKRPCVDWRY